MAKPIRSGKLTRTVSTEMNEGSHRQLKVLAQLRGTPLRVLAERILASYDYSTAIREAMASALPAE